MLNQDDLTKSVSSLKPREVSTMLDETRDAQSRWEDWCKAAGLDGSLARRYLIKLILSGLRMLKIRWMRPSRTVKECVELTLLPS